MNATKRKFNALLQGIGNRSTASVSGPDKSSTSTSTSSAAAGGLSIDGANPSSPSSSAMLFTAPTSLSSADVDVLSKRRRLGLSGSATASALKDSSGNAGNTTITNIVLRKWSGSHVGDDKPPPPRYCPGDREQLLRRLATFSELTDWTPKPDRVSEIEWAKRGWVCQGRERLRCTLCSKELVVKLNRRDAGDGREVPVLVASEIEEALVERYAGLVVSAHQDDCLWRKKGCDDALLRVPLANPQVALEGLRRRYDDLCSRKDFLPYEFNIRLPAGELDLDTVLAGLPPTFFTEPPPPAVLTSSSSPSRAALALALTGWEGLTNSRIGPVPNSASCRTCLRRLGLWMFKSKEVDPDTGAVLVPAPMDHLDPVREHRFFCPWKNGAIQRNPGGGGGNSRRPRPRTGGEDAELDKAGWEVLAQVIKNDAYLRNRNNIGRAARGRDGAPLSTAADATDARRPPTSGSLAGTGSEMMDVDDEAARDAKDKERWARLRKVKSLFDTKGGKKLRRTRSRPGTAHSTLRPDTGHSSLARPDTAGV